MQRQQKKWPIGFCVNDKQEKQLINDNSMATSLAKLRFACKQQIRLEYKALVMITNRQGQINNAIAN